MTRIRELGDELKRITQSILDALDSDADSFHDGSYLEPGIGSVVRFTKQFRPGGKSYVYAAVRTEIGWFVTGAETVAITWKQLWAMAGPGVAIAVATGWERIIAPRPLTCDGPKSPHVFRFRGVHAGAGVALDTGSALAAKTSPEGTSPRSDPVAPVNTTWPFIVERRELFSGDHYAVLFVPTGEIAARFPARENGLIRATQSCRSRQAVYLATRLGEHEPPVGARIRSRITPHWWARREHTGWMIMARGTVCGARWSWTRAVARLDGRGALEPGTYTEDTLFAEPADRRDDYSPEWTIR